RRRCLACATLRYVDIAAEAESARWNEVLLQGLGAAAVDRGRVDAKLECIASLLQAEFHVAMPDGGLLGTARHGNDLVADRAVVVSRTAADTRHERRRENANQHNAGKQLHQRKACCSGRGRTLDLFQNLASLKSGARGHASMAD